MRIAIFGAGPIFLRCAEFLEGMNADCIAFVGPRHLDERYGGDATFGDRLKMIGVRYQVSDDINASAERLNGVSLGMSFGAPWIFRRALIERLNGHLYNMHNAPLPRHRGGGGFSWRILQGDRSGACLIHRVDEGTDTGPIVWRRDFDYPEECRIPADFISHTTTRGADLVREFLGHILQTGTLPGPGLAQEGAFSTYWPRLHTDTHAWIDWRWSAREIERCICAFDDPYAGAQTSIEGNVVRLKQARLADDGERFHPLQYGVVYRITDAIYVACRDGGVRIGQVITSGNRLPRLGDRFTTTEDMLWSALKARVWYDASGART